MVSGRDVRAKPFVAMWTVIDVIVSVVYRVSRGEIGRTRFFCESAEDLVVKFLEVILGWWGTLGRGRG